MKKVKRTLGEIINLKRGYDLPSQKRKKGSIPIISSSGITDFHSEAAISGEGVVTGRYGTLGKIFYINGDYWPLNTTLYVENFKGNSPKFIYYFLKTIGVEKFNGASAVPGLDRNVLHKIEVDFISEFPTQRRIASILSAYDDLIENNLKRIKLLEEKAFVTYKALDKVGKCNLADLYDTSSGGTPSRTNSEYFTGEINWFKSKELKDSILLESEEKITEEAVDKSSAKVFPNGSVIMAMYGATIGKLGLLSTSATTNQACCAIIEKDEIKSNIYILNWLLENREYVLSFRMGAAQENISQQVIKNLLVSIPKDSDLKIFNSETKPVYLLIKNLLVQNTKLREARDILLPRLMSGEIEV
jgi:type I restriction enzyme S subunit